MSGENHWTVSPALEDYDEFLSLLEKSNHHHQSSQASVRLLLTQSIWSWLLTPSLISDTANIHLNPLSAGNNVKEPSISFYPNHF